MRLTLLLALAVPSLAAAASAPLAAERETVDQALARTAAESRQAEARVAQLEARERSASGEAAKLASERHRAAADILLAEARIAEADARLVQARASVALREQRLARRRAPLAALLAGLATMGRRPPILSLADGATVGEVVRVRALVDTTMPLIARRSAALQKDLGERRLMAEQAGAARGQLGHRRIELAEKQERFAALETRALARADALRSSAFGEQDRVMAGGEDLLDLRGQAQAEAAARAAARALAAMPLALPRPFAADGKRSPPPLSYGLPTAAPVINGLGAVSATGVRSRGISFATPRGAAIAAPASGTILFAGAFRRHDGIIVIDHGRGWTSLLIGIAPAVRRGERVEAGAPLGRALGDLSLELRQGGVPRSAALIAGSSQMLSNDGKTRDRKSTRLNSSHTSVSRMPSSA